MVENWIDEICALAGSVKTEKGKRVHSYSVFRKVEFPESLSVFPCALTYTAELRTSYSLGGPCTDLWYGMTEFHLFPDVSKINYPALMRYFGRIQAAFAGRMTLGGKVAYCQLRTDEAGLQGPVVLQYGSEDPHLGIVARWIVKEDVSGKFIVSM